MPAGFQAMSSIRLYLIVVVALVAAGCGGHGSQMTGSTGPNARVAAIGDSITAGKPPVVPYPPRLEALLRRRNPGAEVIDRGVAGQTTAGGRETLASSLATDHPGFVLIMEGTNDVNVGVPASEAGGNLLQMVRQAKVSGAVPVLGTIPPQFGPRRDFMPAVIALNDEIRRVAGEEHVVLADIFRALPDESFITDDGFHPNDQGQTAIVVAFDAALARAGYPAAQASQRRR